MENTLCKQHPQLPIERLSFKVTQSFIGDVKPLRFDFYKIIIKQRTSYYDSRLCHKQNPALRNPIISFWQNFDPNSHILTQNLLIFWCKKSNVTFMHLQFLKRIQMIIQSCRFLFGFNNIFCLTKREILSPISDKTALLKSHASQQTYLYHPYMTVLF